MELNPDFQEFLRSFVAHDVRFPIVGGYALAAHGHPRYTKDLDVWVDRRVLLKRGRDASVVAVADEDLATDVVVAAGRLAAEALGAIHRRVGADEHRLDLLAGAVGGIPD